MQQSKLIDALVAYALHAYLSCVITERLVTDHIIRLVALPDQIATLMTVCSFHHPSAMRKRVQCRWRMSLRAALLPQNKNLDSR